MNKLTAEEIQSREIYSLLKGDYREEFMTYIREKSDTFDTINDNERISDKAKNDFFRTVLLVRGYGIVDVKSLHAYYDQKSSCGFGNLRYDGFNIEEAYRANNLSKNFYFEVSDFGDGIVVGFKDTSTDGLEAEFGLEREHNYRWVDGTVLVTLDVVEDEKKEKNYPFLSRKGLT